MGISAHKLKELLDVIRGAVRHEPCWTCDCLQGLLVQLELDSDDDATPLIRPLRVESARLHRCLGCDPCPPGRNYAEYLQRPTPGP